MGQQPISIKLGYRIEAGFAKGWNGLAGLVNDQGPGYNRSNKKITRRSGWHLAPGKWGISMGDLLASAATFRRCAVEKISFDLLNQCYLFLTVLAAYLGFHELNPLMRYLLTVPLLLVIIKFAVPVLIAWLAPGRLLLPSIILLSLFVAWNLKELLLFLL